jgi:hypothetical protein
LHDPFQRRKFRVNEYTLKFAKRVSPDELQAVKGPVHFEPTKEAYKSPFVPGWLTTRRTQVDIATMPQPDQAWPFTAFQGQDFLIATEALLKEACSGGAV